MWSSRKRINAPRRKVAAKEEECVGRIDTVRGEKQYYETSDLPPHFSGMLLLRHVYRHMS